MDSKQRAVLKEMIRRSRRPYLHYQPGPTQRRFMESACLYKALHGPNRGGKTFHVDMEVAMLLEDRHPRLKNVRDSRFLFVVPGRQSSMTHKEYLVERSKLKGDHGLYSEPMLDMSEHKCIYDTKAQPPALKMVTNTRTGNSILFIWAAAGARMVNLLEGQQFDGAIIDESSGTQNLLDEIYMRILDAQSDPAKPGLGFIWWSFTETSVNQAGTNFLTLCYDQNKPNYAAFRIDPKENPAISMESREEMAKGLSEKARRIRIDGTSSAQGEVSIYPCMVLDKDKLIRTTPYSPGQDDNIVVGFDPGVDHPFGLMFAYLNRYRPSKLQVFHGICRSGEGPADVVRHLGDILCGRKMSMLAYDPFGASRREFGTGKSAIQMILEIIPDDWWAGGFPNVKQPKGRHLIGINTVRAYMQPHESVSREPLVEFDPPSDDNGMGQVIAQLTEYRGREDLNFAGPHGVVKINDEHCDTLRFLCLTSPQWEDHGVNIKTRPRLIPMAATEKQNLHGQILTPEQIRHREMMERSAKIGSRRKGRRR